MLKLYRADASEPDSAWREAHILNLLASSELPVPRTVALDRDGSEAGMPALLMSRMPGRRRMRPREIDPWLQELAAVAARIHALPITQSDLPRHGLWGLDDPLPVPDWWTDAGVWRAAVDVFRGPGPDEPRCFIHRDFHYGNLLWRGGHVSAIVDWLHGCWGPASADLAHCRINLWLDHGPAAAQGWLDAYREINPEMTPYNRYSDIADAMSWHLDPKRDGLDRARRYESFMTAAIGVVAGPNDRQ